MQFFRCGILAALLVFTQSAMALTIESVTTVTDDNGGSLTISSSGSAFADGGSSETDLVANAFSPRGEAALSGELTRSRSRGADSVSTVYNGSFSIDGSDPDGNPVTISVSLQDLAVLRDGQGPDFSGTVVINGTAFDATQLPERAAQVVRRALRLFVFA